MNLSLCKNNVLSDREVEITAFILVELTQEELKLRDEFKEEPNLVRPTSEDVRPRALVKALDICAPVEKADTKFKLILSALCVIVISVALKRRPSVVATEEFILVEATSEVER